MTFEKFVNQLRREGKCQCWDHLRLAGYTPPKGLRGSHPSISPHAVYGKDEGGQPVQTHGKKAKEETKVGESPTEGAAIRAAVRNRSMVK